MTNVNDTVLVSEVPDPEKGMWRVITAAQSNCNECIEWAYSIYKDGRSEVEIRKSPEGWEVWARRR